MRLIAILAAVAGFCALALLLIGKNPASVSQKTSDTDAMQLATVPVVTVERTNAEQKPAEIHFERQLQRLRNAMNEKNDKVKADALRELGRLASQNAAVLENLVDRIKTEPEAEVLLTIGNLVLDTGVPHNQKAVTDTALNVLLSDDTPERRKASLGIVANTPLVTTELCQAVARVSREDLSAEIKDEAAATIEKWVSDRPDLRPKIAEALAGPSAIDEATLSTQQK